MPVRALPVRALPLRALPVRALPVRVAFSSQGTSRTDTRWSRAHRQFFALATHSMEEALEASLGSLISAHRSDMGLSTHWDPQVSALLGLLCLRMCRSLVAWQRAT